MALSLESLTALGLHNKPAEEYTQLDHNYRQLAEQPWFQEGNLEELANIVADYYNNQSVLNIIKKCIRSNVWEEWDVPEAHDLKSAIKYVLHIRENCPCELLEMSIAGEPLIVDEAGENL